MPTRKDRLISVRHILMNQVTALEKDGLEEIADDLKITVEEITGEIEDLD